MDHAEAVTKGAVERYQLGELSEKEIDEFETHFFECAHCADELRSAAIFEENAKAVFLENSRSAAGAGEPRAKYEQARPSRWALFWKNPWSAVPATAAAALLCVVVYQARMMKQTFAAQAMASYVMPSLSRGDDRVLEVPKNDKFYSLYMDPTWPGSYSEYLCVVQDEKGSTWLSVPIAAPPPNKPIQILMPRNQLPSGRYTVIVRNANAAGKPETELGQYSLILKLD
jgi:Putative zinc-finger